MDHHACDCKNNNNSINNTMATCLTLLICPFYVCISHLQCGIFKSKFHSLTRRTCSSSAFPIQILQFRYTIRTAIILHDFGFSHNSEAVHERCFLHSEGQLLLIIPQRRSLTRCNSLISSILHGTSLRIYIYWRWYWNKQHIIIMV